jgi:hypothetical protein
VVFPLALLGLAVVSATLLIVFLISSGRGDPGDAVWTPVYVVFLLFPVSFGVAVLRYKLYEIDRIISRTLTYALVSAVLVRVYLASVFLFGQVLPFESDLAIAAGTLTAAAIFNPARRRIQQIVDRRFNRSRFDAERTLESLSRRLAAEVDLSALSQELVAVTGRTLQPHVFALWLREPAV